MFLWGWNAACCNTLCLCLIQRPLPPGRFPAQFLRIIPPDSVSQKFQDAVTSSTCWRQQRLGSAASLLMVEILALGFSKSNILHLFYSAIFSSFRGEGKKLWDYLRARRSPEKLFATNSGFQSLSDRFWRSANHRVDSDNQSINIIPPHSSSLHFL